MFNAVASFLFGESVEAEEGYKAASEVPQEVAELDLDVHQDDDWLVIGQPDTGVVEPLRDDVAGEAVNPAEEATGAPTVDARRREVHQRHWGIHTAGQSTPEQMLVKVHAAQRVLRNQSNKSMSAKNYVRENKVYDKSNSKNSSRRSKRVRPAGFKAGRMCQRV